MTMRGRTSLSVALGAAALLLAPVAASAAPAPVAPTPITPKQEAAPAPPPPDPHDPNDYVNPIKGGHVISPFGRRGGRRHEGIDIKGPNRTTVFATFAGRVVQAGPGLSGYGNTVTIDHGQGVTTRYAHLASWSVKKGDVVRQGDPIGAEGQTGSATTYHVHYEVRENDVPRDPAPYLRPE